MPVAHFKGGWKHKSIKWHWEKYKKWMKSKSYYSINGGSRPELSAIECLQDHVLIHVKSMPIYYIAENMSVKANTLVLILGSDWLDLKTDFGLLSNILCEPEKAPGGAGALTCPWCGHSSTRHRWHFQRSLCPPRTSPRAGLTKIFSTASVSLLCPQP